MVTRTRLELIAEILATALERARKAPSAVESTVNVDDEHARVDPARRGTAAR